VVFGALFLLGLARAGGLSRSGAGAWAWVEPALYVGIPLAATMALNWQNAKAFNVRYVLVGLPMYLALAAAGLAAVAGARRAAAGAAVVVASVLSLSHHYFDPRYAKEDVRSATRAVEARLAPGECIFAPTVWQIVAHYQRGGAPLHYVYRQPPGLMERQIDALTAACDSFWYLRARPWVDDADGRVLAAIESRFDRGEAMEFAGVSVIHFSRRN
jgi:hypothetical protein